MSTRLIPSEIKETGQMWLLPPYNWPHRKIARELNVSASVVSQWRQELISEGHLDKLSNNNHCEFSPEQRFAMVLETATMSQKQLAEYCRQKGIFVDDINDWKKRSIEAQQSPIKTTGHKENKALREAKKKVKELEKELNRKNKALAETAALLVLREKLNALQEDSEDD